MIKHVYSVLSGLAAGLLAAIPALAFLTRSLTAGHAGIGLFIGPVVLLATTPLIGNANPRGVWYAPAIACLPLAWVWLSATGWGPAWWSLPGLIVSLLAAYGGAVLGARRPRYFQRA